MEGDDLEEGEINQNATKNYKPIEDRKYENEVENSLYKGLIIIGEFKKDWII